MTTAACYWSCFESTGTRLLLSSNRTMHSTILARISGQFLETDDVPVLAGILNCALESVSPCASCVVLNRCSSTSLFDSVNLQRRRKVLEHSSVFKPNTKRGVRKTLQTDFKVTEDKSFESSCQNAEPFSNRTSPLLPFLATPLRSSAHEYS